RNQQDNDTSFAQKVANHQPDPPSTEIKKVVVIAADLASLDANTRIFKGRKRRLRPREESCLCVSGKFHLLRGAPFGFQPLDMEAALRLDFPSHLVRSQERKRIPVRVFKARGHRALRLRLRRMVK